MILFGGAIGWRANKQDTVTTSSTEAELLALSQTAKEAILIYESTLQGPTYLWNSMSHFGDNRQLFDESVKLATKLRHVDIRLRQECRKGIVQL
jgi:hypothetical protein